MTALWSPGIRSLPDKSGLRGLVLSHMIGFAIAIQFLLDRAVTMSIPYNRLIDLPIRLILVWLVIDRVGRQGRMKLTSWDVIYITFIAVQGMIAIYADLYMWRDSGFVNYIDVSLSVLQPFFYFLAVREGLNRKGFKPEILLFWIVGIVGFACILALLQALDLGGARSVIDDFYRQRVAEASMEGASMPWQARGVAPHANSMAMMIMAGFVSLVALIAYRRLGWFELLSGGLLIITLFATYSRTGIVTFVCLAVGYVMVLAVMKKYGASLAVGTGLIAMLVLFVGTVEAFKIERYQVFSKGLSVVKNDPSRGMWGWYQRQKVVAASIRLMEKHPITGVAAATSNLNRQRVIAKNAYTIEGLLLNTYAFAYVSYGVNGIFFVLGILGTAFYQFRYLRTKRVFAVAAIFAGITLAVSGMSETTIFSYVMMIPLNCVMALALTNLPKQENQRPSLLAGLSAKLVRTA